MPQMRTEIHTLASCSSQNQPGYTVTDRKTQTEVVKFDKTSPLQEQLL